MDSGGSTATLATERSHPLGGVVDSHHHHGSCTTGEQKIDVQLTTLQSSAPTEDSLPARIMAKSREVSAQSGRKAAYGWHGCRFHNRKGRHRRCRDRSDYLE